MPHNAAPNYEREYIKEVRRNDAKVLDLLERGDDGLAQKIRTFADRHGFSGDKIIKEIQESEMFRAVFARDPAKQKIHEKIAARYIAGIEGVEDFKQLGHSALVLVRGGVMTKKEAQSRGVVNNAKTIDFSWKFCDKEIYASHKYTRDTGGAQDNQYADIQGFVKEANESARSDKYFIAICDGDYYQTKDSASGVSKEQRLKNLANQRNVFAVSIRELEALLQVICSK